MGTVRIKYTDKKSVFHYANMRKQDAMEKVFEHISVFGHEMALDPTQTHAEQFRAGFQPQPTLRQVDLSTVIAEWVENLGTDKEVVEALTIPTAP